MDEDVAIEFALWLFHSLARARGIVSTVQNPTSLNTSQLAKVIFAVSAVRNIVGTEMIKVKD